MESIVSLYRDPLVRGYVRGKLRGDPVFDAAFELLHATLLPILDIGCGMGLFEFYLRERGCQAALTGVDFDLRKIKKARWAMNKKPYANLHFSHADALAGHAHCGHVVLFDMLHYLDASQQAVLLSRVATQIAPGAYCLIRDSLSDGSRRFLATACGEFVLSAITWQKARAVHYPTIEATCAPFLAHGFTCDVKPLWGRTLFNSFLFTFRAPLAS